MMSGLGKVPQQLPCDAAILLKIIHSREQKIYVPTKICAQMFTAALLIIAKK